MENNEMLNFNDFTKNDQKIISSIRYGKENAITKNELSFITGLDERTIRQRIHLLRENGLIICSCSNHRGYYYPATKTEAIEFYREMMARIKKIAKITKKARDYAFSNENFMQVKFDLG